MTKHRFVPVIAALLLVALTGGCCSDDDTLGILTAPGTGPTGPTGGTGSTGPTGPTGPTGGTGPTAGGVPLGAAEAYGILAGSTITNAGPTSISGGDLAVNGPSVTGFPPGTTTGEIYTNPPDVDLVNEAQDDLTTAYNDAAGRTTGAITVSGDLGGNTLAPGLYKSTSTLEITGTLTLDGVGNSNGVFIFQIASGLTTSTGSQVILSGGAQAQNIYWQVGSSAVLGASSSFSGVILADQSITLTSGATLNGRALTRIGAVTLDNNIVTVP